MQRSNDPHLLSGAKVHSSALIVMPPKELWDPIQAIRSVHDKAYERWMPHINMLYPFVPEKDFDQWVPKLKAALAEFASFQLTFASVNSFSHGGSSTLFLQPNDAAAAILKRIQARLEATVPICNDLSKIGAHGFAPHLTIGQWQGSASAKAAIANFNATWKPITFTVKEFYCISRGRTTPFEIKAPVPLAPAAPVAAPAPAASEPAPAPAVPAPAAATPVVAPAAALAVVLVKEEKNAGNKREHKGGEESVGPLIEPTELIAPADAKSEKVQILQKLLAWYKTNKARNMLPKTRSKLENAIKPMCQVFEEADPMGVWNTLIADQCFSVNNAGKVVYIRKPKPLVPETSYNSYSYNSDEPKERKTTHALVVEKAKQWIAENRDPPAKADGLRNCIKQLCHYKHTVQPAEIITWLIEQKLIEESGDQIVYHFERPA